MEELVRFIVSKLVDDMSVVDIESCEQDGIEVINIITNKDQIGKIIGKQGRIAKAIRTIAKAGANKTQTKVSVEIIER